MYGWLWWFDFYVEFGEYLVYEVYVVFWFGGLYDEMYEWWDWVVVFFVYCFVVIVEDFFVVDWYWLIVVVDDDCFEVFVVVDGVEVLLVECVVVIVYDWGDVCFVFVGGVDCWDVDGVFGVEVVLYCVEDFGDFLFLKVVGWFEGDFVIL